MTQLYRCLYSFSYTFLLWFITTVPCAIQSDLIDMLLIHSVYNSLHLVTLNSHFIPPPPSWQPRVCFLHGSGISGIRQWHPTPVLLPGKSHGQRSLVGCSPWGREESDTAERLHFHFSLSCLEKEMATHSSILAWRIPGTEEPNGLPSIGSHRVGHD